MAATKGITRYHWVVLGLAFAGEASNSLASHVVAPLAPLFQPELGLTKAQVGLFSAATLAGAWSVVLLAGSLTDRFGVRRVLAIGEILTGAVMMFMAMAGSFLQAAAVMFVAGVGTAATGTGPTKAVSEWFPPTTRGTAMGIKQTAPPIAGIVAAASMPALGLMWGWHAAIALAGLSIVIIGAATALLYRAPDRSDTKPRQGWSMRADMARVIGNTYLWKIGLVNLLLVTVHYGVIVYLVLYFQEVVLVPWVPDGGGRVVAAGGYLALCQIGGIVGRLFWGTVSDRFFHGQRLVVLAIVGALMVPLCVAMGALESGYPLWFATGVVFGLGVTAVGYGVLYHVLLPEMVGRRYAATALGFSLTMSQLGKVAGPPAFGFIVDVTGSYMPAWSFLGFIAACGTLMAILCIRGEKHVA